MSKLDGIKAGDRVRVLGADQTFEVIARLKDGRWVLEYDAGDETNVFARDVSCLEKIEN